MITKVQATRVAQAHERGVRKEMSRINAKGVNVMKPVIVMAGGKEYEIPFDQDTKTYHRFRNAEECPIKATIYVPIKHTNAKAKGK